MAITLTVSTTTLTLDPALQWADEFDWFPVEQNVERSLTGALLIDTRARTVGRPITLAGADRQAAWLPRAAVDQLRAWADVPGQQMALVLRGVTYTVMWRHQDGAFEATPVADYEDVVNDDWYRVTLRFMVVA